MEREQVYALVGKSYRFDDGDSIEIIQIKQRNEEDYLISAYIRQGPGIPRKLVFSLPEFIDSYGHLFGITDDNGSDT